MRHSGTKGLFEHWNAARGSGSAPLRRQIAPDAIARLLPSTFIIDAAPQSPRFRLAGTRLCALFGRELTGEPFAEIFAQDDRLLAGRVLTAVNQGEAVAVIDLQADAAGGRQITMEMVLLPLADDVPRVLGGLQPLALPYWLGAYPASPANMVGVRVIDADKPLFSLDNRPSMTLRAPRSAGRKLRVVAGDAVRPREPLANAEERRPALRVLDGGLSDTPE